MADSLDRLVAAPLSVTDRASLSAAARLFAVEAARATDRAGTSTGGPADVQWADTCSAAARTAQELLARRSPR